jgi:hypothetical protein
MRMIRSVLALALSVSSPAAPAPAPAAGEANAKVLEVLTRTKTTTKTYALYLWNRITPPGGAPIEEWSAEFHSGDLHRVETPHDRLVANCRTGAGFAYSMETGRSSEGAWIARTACGIDTNRPFLSAEWQGRVQTPSGEADRVTIVTAELVRRYDISPDGVILATRFADNAPGEAVRLVNWAVAVEAALPAPDIFDRASLARSVVPERYKQPPGPQA